jgi:RNA polymerase sigma-70 factor (ECF subfamily)
MPPLPLPWFLRDARLARLLRRSQRGDREAFRALYQALYGPVARFVRRRVASPADAEDVVAQVFTRLLESLARVDPARGSVLAYVLAMARHALADRARRGRASGAQEEAPPDGGACDGRAQGGEAVLAVLPDPADGALEQLLAREEAARVREGLAALPAEARELLVLRYGDGLRHAEIAQMLGLSEAAVRQRTSRAVRELRARWQAPDGGGRGALANDG